MGDLAVAVAARSREEASREIDRLLRVVDEWCGAVRLALAVPKTQLVLMRGRLSRGSPLVVRYQGARLVGERQGRYLGVEINPGRTATPQLEVVAGKLERTFALFRTVARNVWDADYPCRARYFRVVFMPTLLYGSAWWWYRPTRAQRAKVLSLQWQALDG